MIDRFELLAFLGRPNDNLSVSDFRTVKSMQRLATFHHDVIGHVDNVIHHANANGGQSILQPLRTRPDFDATDQPRDIAKAMVWSSNVDRHIACNLIVGTLDFSGRDP